MAEGRSNQAEDPTLARLRILVRLAASTLHRLVPREAKVQHHCGEDLCLAHLQPSLTWVNVLTESQMPGLPGRWGQERAAVAGGLPSSGWTRWDPCPPSWPW